MPGDMESQGSDLGLFGSEGMHDIISELGLADEVGAPTPFLLPVDPKQVSPPLGAMLNAHHAHCPDRSSSSRWRGCPSCLDSTLTWVGPREIETEHLCLAAAIGSWMKLRPLRGVPPGI